MSDPELAPEVFTADYEGEPGNRTFYLQARSSASVATYLVEKQQVAALADELRRLLLLVDSDDTVARAEPARDPALSLVSPVAAGWRVGTMGLAYDQSTDRFLVTMAPLEADDDDAAAPTGEAGPEVALLLRRDQARAFVLHATAVVGEGRPSCRLCGLPMDPGGHVCPASNGHRG